jgi:hypothetical protein
VFREPRNAADVETALRSFSDAVARFSVGSDVVSSSVSTAVHNKPSQTGALMLCVCGGKLSEGINFKDALGRLVVMVGLPYANPEEPELKATRGVPGRARRLLFFMTHKKNKLNERAKTKTRGRRYYEALCMRSVNQSVGRAIRHVGDYAAILLCDRRYVTAPEVSTTSFQTTNEGERDQVEKKKPSRRPGAARRLDRRAARDAERLRADAGEPGEVLRGEEEECGAVIPRRWV